MSNFRAFCIGALTVATIWALPNDWKLHDGTEPGLPGNTPTTSCTEDMACWDCSTMGNLACGPTP